MILPVHIGLVGSCPSGELVLVIVVLVGNNVGFMLSGGELFLEPIEADVAHGQEI